MTIEEAIEKAIEGGYADKNAIFIRPKSFIYKKTHRNINLNEMLLDPLWWQALGKSLGWNFSKEFDPLDEPRHAYDQIDEWLEKWHEFIDHLADGGSIDSYFESLT